jgi:hypothetical protein
MVNRQKVLDCVAQSVLLLGRQDDKLARLMQLSKEVRNMEEEMVLLMNALQGPVLGYTRARCTIKKGIRAVASSKEDRAHLEFVLLEHPDRLVSRFQTISAEHESVGVVASQRFSRDKEACAFYDRTTAEAKEAAEAIEAALNEV